VTNDKINQIIKAISLFVFILIGFSEGAPDKEYLVSVSLQDQNRIFELSDLHMSVIEELDGYALVLCGPKDINILKINQFPYSLTDSAPFSKIYFLISKSDIEKTHLERCGDIINNDGIYVLLRTTEDKIIELNRLPVKLKRIFFKPIIINKATYQVERKPSNDSAIVRLDSTIVSIMQKVSFDSIYSTIYRLQSFRTRYSTTDSCYAAAQFVADRFSDYGLDSVYLHSWRINYAPNTVGIKWGQLYPNLSYIICAHLDATSNQAPLIAPGADDNASGGTAVLEAARVLKDYDFDYTIKFVTFTGEEQGLLGSDTFAHQSYLRSDTILGVLNFDMIAYGLSSPILRVYGKNSNPNCEWLVDNFIATADTYTILSTNKRMVNSAAWSDHSSFWRYGYTALCGIENDNNPYYHQTSDTLGSGANNLTFATEGIKAAIATLAKLAHVNSLSVEENSEAKSSIISLHQNYPNPFTKYTTIRYSLSSLEKHDLKIYDVMGKLVKSILIDENIQNIVWNRTDNRGERVCPGVYFYRIESKTTLTPFLKVLII